MSKTKDSKRAIATVSDTGWAEAVRREGVLRPLARADRHTKAEIAAAAAKLDLSPPRIYDLLRHFRADPVTSSLLPHKPGPAKGGRRLDPAIETEIERAIDAVFMKRERPTLKRVLTEVGLACRLGGFLPPSMKALRARVSTRTLRARVKAREGAASAGDRFRQVRPGLRPERPLQVVQIDHTKVDIMLVDDATRACIGRPWLTLVLDVQTRMVLGLFLSLDPPSATSAALAVAQAVMSKEDWLADRSIELPWPAFGLPELIHVDNGREFHSRAFERGCQQHGVRIEYRPPATPRFGGHIERLMGTLMGRVHALPGSTSSNIAARGSYDAEANAVLTFREFERILALEVLGPYHNEVHSALACSPAAAWARGIADVQLRSPADHDKLLLDFLPFEERIVRRDGVRLFSIFYQDGALAHLVDSGAGKLRIKYDPRNLAAVFVELPAGDHLRVPYAEVGRNPITLWEHRQVVRQLRAEGRQTIDQQAIFAAIEEQRRVLMDAQGRSKAARRAVARTGALTKAAGPAVTPVPAAGEGGQDNEAQVPMPSEGETSGVEFW